ncbi:hypothetical protein LY76DRAFT_247797 [Colletotrichum caudatum]|nr:hypothetical protein LY76DRAFT_247797 [Colletotrichum caudatum]
MGHDQGAHPHQNIRTSDTIQNRQVGSIADGRIASVRLGRIKSCKQSLGMTGALLDSQPPRIEELGRPDRCSSASTSSTSASASISTRSPPLYYGATPLAAGAGDERRMNLQQLAKVSRYRQVPYPPYTPSLLPYFLPSFLPLRNLVSLSFRFCALPCLTLPYLTLPDDSPPPCNTTCLLNRRFLFPYAPITTLPSIQLMQSHREAVPDQQDGSNSRPLLAAAAAVATNQPNPNNGSFSRHSV